MSAGWVGAPHVLRDYALLADGERGALVGPHGDIVWMCFPHWDSDALFSALIGGGGTYAITPTDRHVWGGYYEPRSLIWRSRWATCDAIVECRQALALPAEPDRATILRRVVALRGTARLSVVLNPRAGYGRRGMRKLTRDDGAWRASIGELRVGWSGGAGASATRRGGHRALELTLTLREGDEHDFVLALTRHGDATPPDAEAAWQRHRTGLAPPGPGPSPTRRRRAMPRTPTP